MADNDNIQHGLDDDSTGDAGKGAALGGAGGAVVGALAGSVIGPVGTLIGAAVGAISGAVASGAAVAAVDAVDNDNTVSGVGSGTTGGMTSGTSTSDSYMTGAPGEHGHNIVTGDTAKTDAGASGLTTGAVVGGVVGAAVGGPVGAIVGGTAGSLLGGVAGDATEAPDDVTTRGSNLGTAGMSGTSTPTSAIEQPYGGETSTMGTSAMGATPLMGTTSTMDTTSNMTSALPKVSREEYDRLDEAGRQRVQLLEEELHVGKDKRAAGEVEISKRIVEEQVSVPVTLEREELVITRKTGVTGDVVGEGAFTDEVITVPLSEEFATVSKTAHVAEEIEIEKRTISQDTTVGGTVRHEELEVSGDQASRVRTEGDV